MPTIPDPVGPRAVQYDPATKTYREEVIVVGAAGVSAPVTVADGADVAQGAVADVVVAAGAAGTISAKLRRLTTDLSALLAQAVAGIITVSKRGVYTDRSGVTTGADQVIMNANLARSKAVIVNADDTNTLWINFGAAANPDQPSIPILPFGTWMEDGLTVSTEAIHGYGAVAAKSFAAKEI